MDTQTRHALKQDNFTKATASSIGWLETHRSEVIRLSVVVIVVLAALAGGAGFYLQRSAAAQIALGQAATVYTSPLQQPGAPPDPTSYTTSAARAREANREFVAIADRYGWLEAGRNARYFAGLSFMDLGQTAQAESSLKQVADSHDSNLAALAKSALASLYHQSGRDDQAVQIYQELIAKPTDTVPAAAAELQLAALYEASKPAEAKRIYAELEDKDKDTAAGQIAAQKLKGTGK